MNISSLLVKKKYEKRMKDSPLDYLLAIKFAQKVVSPKLMQRCIKEYIPTVFVKITDLDELKRLPWSWIRQFSFPYHRTIFPVFRQEITNGQAKTIWSKMMSDAKLSHSKESLIKGAPISIPTLKKLV